MSIRGGASVIASSAPSYSLGLTVQSERETGSIALVVELRRLAVSLRFTTSLAGRHCPTDTASFTVRVTNINRAFEFYKGLGLVPVVGGLEHYARFVCPDGDATFSIEKLSEGKLHSTTTVYFECDKLDEKVNELKSQGYVFDEDPTDQSWFWREAYLRDPDDNLICLFYAGENRLNPPWRLKE